MSGLTQPQPDPAQEHSAPAPGRRLLGRRLSRNQYLLVLAVAAAAFLAVGATLRPRKEIKEKAISQLELVRLQRMAQRKSLRDLASYFNTLSNEVAPHLVRVKDREATGIVWDARGLIVIAAPWGERAQPVDLLDAAGREIRAAPVAFSPELPAGAVRAVDPAVLKPVTFTPLDMVETGTWLLVVSVRPDGGLLFTPGMYSGATRGVCGEQGFGEIQTGLALNHSMLGGGVFDMDGGLIGMVFACRDQYMALTVESVKDILARQESMPAQMLQRYGMRVEALDAATQKYFRAAAGALVTEVRRDGLADRAGLVPGDVIRSLDGEPVNTPDGLQRLVLPLAQPSFALGVWRGGRLFTLTLAASETSVRETHTRLFGFSLESPQGGLRIGHVLPGSRASASGLQAGDLLVAIDGRPVDSSINEQTLAARMERGPTYLTLERGTRRLGILVNR